MRCVRFKLFFLLIMILFSCKQSTESIKVANSGSLIPGGIGTYWIYIDSVYAGDSLKVKIDTITVVSHDSLDEYNWWTIDKERNATLFIYPRFTEKNDTIINHYDIWKGNYLPRTVFIPTIPETLTYKILAAIDENNGNLLYYRYNCIYVNKIYQSKIGSYLGYCIYFINYTYHKDFITIIPGIGVVNRKTTYNLHSYKKHTSTLIEYNIAN